MHNSVVVRRRLFPLLTVSGLSGPERLELSRRVYDGLAARGPIRHDRRRMLVDERLDNLLSRNLAYDEFTTERPYKSLPKRGDCVFLWGHEAPLFEALKRMGRTVVGAIDRTFLSDLPNDQISQSQGVWDLRMWPLCSRLYAPTHQEQVLVVGCLARRHPSARIHVQTDNLARLEAWADALEEATRIPVGRAHSRHALHDERVTVGTLMTANAQDFGEPRLFVIPSRRSLDTLALVEMLNHAGTDRVITLTGDPGEVLTATQYGLAGPLLRAPVDRLCWVRCTTSGKRPGSADALAHKRRRWHDSARNRLILQITRTAIATDCRVAVLVEAPEHGEPLAEALGCPLLTNPWSGPAAEEPPGALVLTTSWLSRHGTRAEILVRATGGQDHLDLGRLPNIRVVVDLEESDRDSLTRHRHYCGWFNTTLQLRPEEVTLTDLGVCPDNRGDNHGEDTSDKLNNYRLNHSDERSEDISVRTHTTLALHGDGHGRETEHLQGSGGADGCSAPTIMRE